MANSQSLITLQKMLDKVLPLGDVNPVLVNVSGYQLEPYITICEDVYSSIVGVPFPHPWNQLKLPKFYSNSYQQDYILLNPDGSSVYNVEWLERGICIEMTNTQLPKPWGYVECGRSQTQATGTLVQPGTWGQNPTFVANRIYNYMQYTGTWGASLGGNPSLGNDPGPGSIYTNPLGASVTDAAWDSTAGGQIVFSLNYIPNGIQVGNQLVVSVAFPVGYSGTFTIIGISGLEVTVTSTSNPGAYSSGGIVGGTAAQPGVTGQAANPITQITDPNGNLQVVTTYGTCGNNPPAWPASNAAPGTRTTDGTVVWTVADPNGIGVRLLPVMSQTGVVFQFNLIGQMPAIQFNSLSDTFAPFPDKYQSYFRQGIIAQCYRYSTDPKIRAKFPQEFANWLKTLNDLRATQDRELEEYEFTPERTIMGGGIARSNYIGAAWPFQYPY